MKAKRSSTDPDSARLRKALSAEARKAAAAAYAPYSRFRVGAAVLGASGTIYRGANVENASCGLSICAERVALASARVAGEKNISAIAVACIDAPQNGPLEQKMPCGACRQWMQELAPGARIFIAGEQSCFGVSELLPRPFKLTRASNAG